MLNTENMGDEHSAHMNEEDTLSLLDLITVVVKRRVLIISTTLIAALLIVLFSILTLKLSPDSRWNFLPNVYRPKVKVLVKGEMESQSTVASLLSSGGGSSLASLMGVGAGVNTSAELAQALLEGNNIKDQIAGEYNFVDRYNITKYPRTSARNIIEGALEVEYFAESSILQISYEDIDPVFATEVLNSIVDVLEETFQELTLKKVRRKKTFLEERLVDVGKELENAQDNLVEFQKTYGIIDISIQAQEHIRTDAGLRAQILNKEIEVQTLLEYLKEDDPQIVRLQNEIRTIKKSRSELKSGFDEFSPESIPQNEIAEITPTYLNLSRDLSILETIYSMLRQQYETVKIEETDTSEIFQRIEGAEVPEMKSGPSRLKICIIIIVVAFFLSVFLSFIKEYVERIKRDPIESRKLKILKDTFL